MICVGQLYGSGCVGCSHVKTMIPLSYPTCKYLIKGIEFQVLPECGHNDLYIQIESLLGCHNSEFNLHVGADHHVCQCGWESSSDKQCQDDRGLASFLSDGSFY